MNSLIADFKQFLKSRGLKMTRQRSLVLEAFLKCNSHVCAEELWHKLRKDHPFIGQATVFRNLKLFVEAGIVNQAYVDKGAKVFEPAAGGIGHLHLICLRCNKVFEQSKNSCFQSAVEACKKIKFSPCQLNLQVYGTCKDCLKKDKGIVYGRGK